MNQNTTTEEEKSEVDKKSCPKLISLSDLPLWLVTGFVLLLISWIFPIYYLF